MTFQEARATVYVVYINGKWGRRWRLPHWWKAEGLVAKGMPIKFRCVTIAERNGKYHVRRLKRVSWGGVTRTLIVRKITKTDDILNLQIITADLLPSSRTPRPSRT